MSYPDYPENKLIIYKDDNTPIYLDSKFKMILVDGYTLSPPEPKLYTVDIPGGNGSIDLTEALNGDVVYNNRKQEFTFYIVDLKDKESIYTEERYFEKIKMEVSNLLHGRSYDYVLTMDVNREAYQYYRYHGRFSVSGYTHGSYANGLVGIIKLSIDAEPYKKLEQIDSFDAVGGRMIAINNGRMRAKPKMSFDPPPPYYNKSFVNVEIVFKDRIFNLKYDSEDYNFMIVTCNYKGKITTSRIKVEDVHYKNSNGYILDGVELYDISFDSGDNEIYVNTAKGRHYAWQLTWKEAKTDIKWGDLMSKRLCEWYNNGRGYLHSNNVTFYLERGEL